MCTILLNLIFHKNYNVLDSVPDISQNQKNTSKSVSVAGDNQFFPSTVTNKVLDFQNEQKSKEIVRVQNSQQKLTEDIPVMFTQSVVKPSSPVTVERPTPMQVQTSSGIQFIEEGIGSTFYTKRMFCSDTPKDNISLNDTNVFTSSSPNKKSNVTSNFLTSECIFSNQSTNIKNSDFSFSPVKQSVSTDNSHLQSSMVVDNNVSLPSWSSSPSNNVTMQSSANKRTFAQISNPDVDVVKNLEDPFNDTPPDVFDDTSRLSWASKDTSNKSSGGNIFLNSTPLLQTPKSSVNFQESTSSVLLPGEVNESQLYKHLQHPIVIKNNPQNVFTEKVQQKTDFEIQNQLKLQDLKKQQAMQIDFENQQEIQHQKDLQRKHFKQQEMQLQNDELKNQQEFYQQQQQQLLKRQQNEQIEIKVRDDRLKLEQHQREQAVIKQQEIESHKLQMQQDSLRKQEVERDQEMRHQQEVEKQKEMQRKKELLQQQHEREKRELEEMQQIQLERHQKEMMNQHIKRQSQFQSFQNQQILDQKKTSKLPDYNEALCSMSNQNSNNFSKQQQVKVTQKSSATTASSFSEHQQVVFDKHTGQSIFGNQKQMQHEHTLFKNQEVDTNNLFNQQSSTQSETNQMLVQNSQLQNHKMDTDEIVRQPTDFPAINVDDVVHQLSHLPPQSQQKVACSAASEFTTSSSQNSSMFVENSQNNLIKSQSNVSVESIMNKASPIINNGLAESGLSRGFDNNFNLDDSCIQTSNTSNQQPHNNIHLNINLQGSIKPVVNNVVSPSIEKAISSQTNSNTLNSSAINSLVSDPNIYIIPQQQKKDDTSNTYENLTNTIKSGGCFTHSSQSNKCSSNIFLSTTPNTNSFLSSTSANMSTNDFISSNDIEMIDKKKDSNINKQSNPNTIFNKNLYENSGDSIDFISPQQIVVRFYLINIKRKYNNL